MMLCQIPSILGGTILGIRAAFRHEAEADCGSKSEALATRKGMSQEELADRAEINRNYVGMVERSENAATVDLLEKLAEALGAKPVDFFREE